MNNAFKIFLDSTKINDKISKNNKYLYSPIFINHSSDLTGAPTFLYNLVEHLNSLNIFKNIILAEPFYNEQRPVDPKIVTIYYENNILVLLKSIIDINPVFIYSNSQNQFLYNNQHYAESFNYKTLFHFHECMQDFYTTRNPSSSDLTLKEEKIFVVAEEIKKEFENTNYKNVSIFPPFISQEKINSITKLSQENVNVNNNFRNLDKNKIIIGMSGSISERKNFSLFYELACANPDKEFIWIGGNNQELEAYINIHTQKGLKNFFHIPNTTNPWAYYNLLDYFFLTSRRDPCPYVLLENLFLNKKIITLKNNIFYKHNPIDLENYIIIDNDNLSDNDIVNEFSKLHLDKNKNITIKNKSYILNNFSSPKILKQENNSKENYLILSYFYDKSSEIDNNKITYLTNLINFFNIINGLSFKIIICINSDYSNQEINNEFKDILNIDKIINRPNRGYDIGGLIEGLKYINDNKHINNETKLAYLHNKSNFLWAEEINKIFYQNNIDNYDTIVSDKFFVPYNSVDDSNKQTMIDHPEIFGQLYFKSFNYIQGTTFITNFKNLKPLIERYNIIMKQLTDISKNDTHWINLMSNDDTFNKYYNYYKYNIFNDPIDKESQILVKEGKAFNFIELKQKFGLKGIPDGSFEHALERYIGYLISYHLNIFKV